MLAPAAERQTFGGSEEKRIMETTGNRIVTIEARPEPITLDTKASGPS